MEPPTENEWFELFKGIAESLKTIAENKGKWECSCEGKNGSKGPFDMLL